MRKTHREWEQRSSACHMLNMEVTFFHTNEIQLTRQTHLRNPQQHFFYSAYYYGFFKLLLLLCYSRYANNPTRPINLLIIFKVVQNHKMEYKKFLLHIEEKYSCTHCLKITQNVAFELWHFPPIFDLLQLTCLVTLFGRKLQVFKNSPKIVHFWHF